MCRTETTTQPISILVVDRWSPISSPLSTPMRKRSTRKLCVQSISSPPEPDDNRGSAVLGLFMHRLLTEIKGIDHHHNHHHSHRHHHHRRRRGIRTGIVANKNCRSPHDFDNVVVVPDNPRTSPSQRISSSSMRSNNSTNSSSSGLREEATTVDAGSLSMEGHSRNNQDHVTQRWIEGGCIIHNPSPRQRKSDTSLPTVCRQSSMETYPN